MSAVSARGGRRRTAVTLGSLGVGVALLLGACAAPGASDTDDGDGNGGSGGGSLSVWVDAARTPGAKQFKKEHPELDIHLTTIPNDPGYVLTKISLANEAGKGWPDVVFLNTPEDVASLATKTFDYAQPVNDLVDDNVVEGFAEGSLSGCTFSGTLYCLRNDIGQTVLWYNKSLMTKFGYDVPQTWEAYGALGARVAKEHPGYVIGDLNGKWGAGVYFTSSGCATRDVVDLKTVRIDTTGPKCARVAELLDPLLANGTVSTLSASDPAFAKLGRQNKILMLPAASWYGDYRFKTSYKSPSGQIAAAKMPTWKGEDTPYSGSVGGGAFVISKHAKSMDAAVQFATWMTTNVDYQATQPTYPAFVAAAKAWGEKKSADAFYAEDPFPAMKAEAPLIRKTFGWVRYANEWNSTFNDTVVSAGDSDAPLSDAVQQWGDRLTKAAEADHYDVVQ